MTRSTKGSETVRVRLQDVAAEAGVSMITVSRCLNNPDRVSAETRERVLAIAARLNYITNHVASSLASTRTKTVAVVLPTISNPIHSETLQGITDVLTPGGYRILVGDHGYAADREAQLVQVFLGYQVDGLIVTGLSHTPECAAMIRRSGIPVVETLDIATEPLDMAVGFSNFEAGRAITRYLLDRGRKRLAFVGHAAIQDTRAAARKAGFLAALSEVGSQPTMLVDIRSTSDEQGAREAIVRILDEASDTDGIVFVGHLSGAAAIRQAHDLGVPVPGRVAIAAMGDSPIGSWTVPSLTTVRFPFREIGTTAARMLLARLMKEPVEQKVVDLGYSIIERESA
jgi:LacI family gluconate utilization system Gnt-I transcriptional repressor